MPQVPPPKRHPYDQWSPDARALDLVGDKWTLLIVRDLAAGPRRFVELQRVLPGISTEQLRSRLNRMVADGMLTRKRYREVPPRVDYELTPRARDLMPVLGELALWGYRWAWSQPRAGERVDVGAILRLGRFPDAGSPSQFDEVSYLSNGLLLLEGETPINKYAPSGPLTWLSAAYSGVKALLKLIADKADLADFPAILRPAAALQSALFDLYTDMTGLRLTVVVLTILLTLAAVVAAPQSSPAQAVLRRALSGVRGTAST